MEKELGEVVEREREREREREKSIEVSRKSFSNGRKRPIEATSQYD